LTYDPKRIELIGALSSNVFWRDFPTFLQLFQVFWTLNVVRDIMTEINRYATSVDANANTKGGPSWTACLVKELHVFIAIIMYMGMKRQLNMKSYWHKKGSIFHCATILSLMS
jgi:Transposase IS4